MDPVIIASLAGALGSVGGALASLISSAKARYAADTERKNPTLHERGESVDIDREAQEVSRDESKEKPRPADPGSM